MYALFLKKEGICMHNGSLNETKSHHVTNPQIIFPCQAENIQGYGLHKVVDTFYILVSITTFY
jgi:hypothetical protein